MPIQVREKRRINFQNKVITPATIQRIANIIDHEAVAIDSPEEYILVYSVDAFDNSSYESTSKEIFSSAGIIETKTLKRIQMRFQTMSNNKNIEVQINHSQKKDDVSFALVGGSESNWVNGVISRISEIVNSADTQPKFKNEEGLYLAILGATLLLNIIYFKLFFNKIDNMESELLRGIFIIGVPIITFFLCNRIHTYLMTLWPDVELQTGPGYQQIPLRKRKKLIWIITVIVLPILLGFIYDLLKNVLDIFN